MTASSAFPPQCDAVVLLGFGGPTGPEEIRPFIDRVLNGRFIPQSRYDDVVDHYVKIGGRSPYNDLTRQQADAVARALRSHGIETPVEVAYRNTPPFVESVMDRLTRQNAKHVFCIVLAPHQSSASWDKYVASVENARRVIGPTAPHVTYIRPYFDELLFIVAHAQRVSDALASFGRSGLDGIELIFTAHSIPLAATGSDLYARQISRSAQLIAQAADVSRWSIAYQSRSGTSSERWLEPDIRDVIRELPRLGVREAVIAPIGFICDHVEVLYDLDIEAKSVAREAGVRIERAEALNDHPLFIQMLAEQTIAALGSSVIKR